MFIPNKARPGKHHAQCRPCRAADRREKYRSDPAFRERNIANAIVSTRKRRERPEVREKERIASREAKRRQLADPVEYQKHLERGRQWRAANPDRATKFKHEQLDVKAARAKRLYDERMATEEGRALLRERGKRYAWVSDINRRARKLKAGGKITRADVIAKLEEQCHRCFWCSADISDGKHTADHFTALTNGGSNDPSNIVMACRSCNSRKWRLSPTEFARRIGRIDLIAE